MVLRVKSMVLRVKSMVLRVKSMVLLDREKRGQIPRNSRCRGAGGGGGGALTLNFLLQNIKVPPQSGCGTASLAQWLRRPPRERKSPSSIPARAGIFSEWSHTSDLKIGTPVATLPGAWCYRVSTGTDWPGVSILWLGGVESLVCNFYLSVAARKIVWADPSVRYTSMLLGR